ncbi:hypothetical protein KM043_005217 [Ampulex compressa]|nr:hypothetical protein KM043_005217 [Ampulex compressa]
MYAVLRVLARRAEGGGGRMVENSGVYVVGDEDAHVPGCTRAVGCTRTAGVSRNADGSAGAMIIGGILSRDFRPSANVSGTMRCWGHVTFLECV